MTVQTTLEIVEPFQGELKHFSNSQDFLKYYALHKSDIDSLSTYKLNKSFLVPGYRFTRVTDGGENKVLKLRKDYDRGLADARYPSLHVGGASEHHESGEGASDGKAKNDMQELLNRVTALEADFYSFTAHVNKYLA